jgi:hypothetical protein
VQNLAGLGIAIFVLSGIPMLYFYVVTIYQWWGLVAAVVAFFLPPLAFLFPGVYWFIEGTPPTLYLACWAIGMAGMGLAGLATQAAHE